MASHIEMQRLAGDAAAVRSVAAQLLALEGAQWTDWELDFLDNMAAHQGPDPLTQRQREVLVELRDGARSFARVGGLSVAGLVRDCWIARADLGEEDEAFVAALQAAGTKALKRRPLLRLMRCAREVGLVEGYVDLG